MPLHFNNLPIDKIKVENRNFVVSKLHTGDLIKVKADFLPIIYHYGIVEKNQDGIFVYHNDPFKTNSKGGNIVKDTIEKFLNQRDIVSVEKTTISTEDLQELYEKLKSYKYDFINFNCEHFINFAKGNKYASSQVIRWTGAIAMGVLIYYLLKRKKL